MRKTAITFLPEAIQIPIDEDGNEIEISDCADELEYLYSKLSAETTLLSMLSRLSDREKIFLLYQVLNVFGYTITQEMFARTLNISRITYINKMNDLRSKLKTYLRGNK